MLVTEDDIFLFNEGSHFHLADRLGAHLTTRDGAKGCSFSVWAPNAQYVSVIGDFNGWNRESHPMTPQKSSGIWSGFVPGAPKGSCYKYFIRSHHNGYEVEKADPVGIRTEEPPRTGSVIWDLDYQWKDADWMSTRKDKHRLDSPVSIYEVHLGSWMRVPEEEGRWLTYRELADQLIEYVTHMGYTHIELMPITEHPFDGSWGYQTTGYFAATCRFGRQEDFMAFIDAAHHAGIGVLIVCSGWTSTTSTVYA